MQDALLCPVAPREPSEGLARPPTAVSDVHVARDRARGASGSIRPRRPSIERRGASVPRGCIPRRKSAILAYRVIAHWHLGVGIHELWRRACTGFPPAVWSPSLSGWLPTTPPQGGSHMAATIAPAPKQHQRKFVSTLAAAARKADLAARHYRIPPTGRQAAEGAFGRFRPPDGSDGPCAPCASDRPPDEHRHGADFRLVGAGHLHVGPAGVRRPQDAPAVLYGHQPHQHRAAGTVRPHPHDAAVGRRLVGIDARTKPPVATSGVSVSVPSRSTNVCALNTAPLPIPSSDRPATNAPWCSASPRGRLVTRAPRASVTGRRGIRPLPPSRHSSRGSSRDGLLVGQGKHRVCHPALEPVVVHELLEQFRVILHHRGHDPQ